jgi:hypothetical protein
VAVAVGLAVAVALALAVAVAVALAVALAVGLAMALAVGLAMALAVGLAYSFCCAEATGANSKTTTALKHNRSNNFFTKHSLLRSESGCRLLITGTHLSR